MILLDSPWQWLNTNGNALSFLLACFTFYYLSREKIHADLRRLAEWWPTTKPVRWAIVYAVAMIILLPLSAYALLASLPFPLWLTITLKVLSFWLIACSYVLFRMLRQLNTDLDKVDKHP